MLRTLLDVRRPSCRLPIPCVRVLAPTVLYLPPITPACPLPVVGLAGAALSSWSSDCGLPRAIAVRPMPSCDVRPAAGGVYTIAGVRGSNSCWSVSDLTCLFLTFSVSPATATLLSSVRFVSLAPSGTCPASMGPNGSSALSCERFAVCITVDDYPQLRSDSGRTMLLSLPTSDAVQLFRLLASMLRNPTLLTDDALRACERVCGGPAAAEADIAG